MDIQSWLDNLTAVADLLSVPTWLRVVICCYAASLLTRGNWTVLKDAAKLSFAAVRGLVRASAATVAWFRRPSKFDTFRSEVTRLLASAPYGSTASPGKGATATSNPPPPHLTDMSGNKVVVGDSVEILGGTPLDGLIGSVVAVWKSGYGDCLFTLKVVSSPTGTAGSITLCSANACFRRKD